MLATLCGAEQGTAMVDEDLYLLHVKAIRQCSPCLGSCELKKWHSRGAASVRLGWPQGPRPATQVCAVQGCSRSALPICPASGQLHSARLCVGISLIPFAAGRSVACPGRGTAVRVCRKGVPGRGLLWPRLGHCSPKPCADAAGGSRMAGALPSLLALGPNAAMHQRPACWPEPCWHLPVGCILQYWRGTSLPRPTIGPRCTCCLHRRRHSRLCRAARGRASQHQAAHLCPGAYACRACAAAGGPLAPQ